MIFRKKILKNIYMISRKKIFQFLIIDDMCSDSDDRPFYSNDWTKNIKNMSNRQFEETFRMKKLVFDKLLKYIKDNSCLNISKNHLIIFIFYISHISTYRKLREIFGIPYATIFRIVKNVSNIVYKLATAEIIFPEPHEYEELKQGFYQIASISGTIMAIDGTHIPITRPKINPYAYYNRKSFFSINVVCLVDHKLRFRGVTYGHGSSHDMRILRISNIRDKIENIADSSVFIIGDSAFSSFSNIKITESTRSNPITQDESYKLKQQRILVENAFGLFKGKFKRFDVRNINGEKNKNMRIFLSAIWIHNFLINEK